jgi:hypothetical protein
MRRRIAGARVVVRKRAASHGRADRECLADADREGWRDHLGQRRRDAKRSVGQNSSHQGKVAVRGRQREEHPLDGDCDDKEQVAVRANSRSIRALRAQGGTKLRSGRA